MSGEHEIGNCVMVFGEVVHLAARRDVLAADGLPDARAVDPLARLGRAEWTTLGEVFALPRIRYDDWEQGSRSATLTASDDSRWSPPDLTSRCDITRPLSGRQVTHELGAERGERGCCGGSSAASARPA